MRRRYDWVPDIPDKRDHKYRAAALLPTHVDLRPGMSNIEDQENLGSCTAQAIAGALEYLERKSGTAESFFEVSRLFLYYGERVIERSTKYDDGAMLRTGVKVCNRVGYCNETLWPYKIAKFANRPATRAYADAHKHKIAEYSRANTLNDFRSALADGFPVVFGFAVYESFESDAVMATGQVPMPGRSEELYGGHAVLMVGYDDELKQVICRNSWGKEWGKGGYFFMPYEYVVDRELSDDFWVIRK